MNPYRIPIQIRWADIDQNRHLRHSAYYDFGAAVRTIILNTHGLTSDKFEELKIGPVLFREEAIFKREIRLEDRITLDCELLKATPDYARWSLRHHFYKEDGTVAALLTIEGAWMDLERRKLTPPGEFIENVFKSFPKAKEFQWMPDRKG